MFALCASTEKEPGQIFARPEPLDTDGGTTRGDQGELAAGALPVSECPENFASLCSSMRRQKACESKAYQLFARSSKDTTEYTISVNAGPCGIDDQKTIRDCIQERS